MPRYVVEFVGGGSAFIEVGPSENLDIALSEQFTAYGDCEIEVVWDQDDPNRDVIPEAEPSPLLSEEKSRRLWKEYFNAFNR